MTRIVCGAVLAGVLVLAASYSAAQPPGGGKGGGKGGPHGTGKMKGKGDKGGPPPKAA